MMIKNATLSLLLLAGMMSGSSAKCECEGAQVHHSTTQQGCERLQQNHGLHCTWHGMDDNDKPRMWQGGALLTLEADADSHNSNYDHDAPTINNQHQQHELPIKSANIHSGSGSTRMISQHDHDVNNSGGQGTSSFSDGLSRGQSTAQRIWLRMGNDCTNTNALRSTFDDRIQSEIHSRGWYRSGRNVEETSFNKGATIGMQQIVDEYAKKCFNDSAAADVCIDLGDLSAFDLALRHCGSTRTSSRGAFHSVCRDIGISQCQGSVFSRVADLCGPPSTSELLSLQNECESAVMRRS